MSTLASASVVRGIAEQCCDQGVARLPVYIPQNVHTDNYYAIHIDFDNQILPVMLDTGSADIVVASTQCSTEESSSGCYEVPREFEIEPSTKLLKNESFYTIIGTGPLSGNQSIQDVKFGSIEAEDLAVALVYEAAPRMMQNGSFAGIWGVAPRNVSRQLLENDRMPPVDALIAAGKLAAPVFSVQLPRYKDRASPDKGHLILGAVGHSSNPITYSEVLRSPNYNYDNSPLTYQSWSIALESIRINGHEVNVPPSVIVSGDPYHALLDTGSSYISFLTDLFDDIATHFKGKTIYQEGYNVAFDCSVPQELEFKLNSQWIPINPLDLIQPGQWTQDNNGTQMCTSPLYAPSTGIADSVFGGPFMRNVLAVFDYISNDTYSVPPQVGLSPITDMKSALELYKSAYKLRAGNSNLSTFL